MNYRVKRELDQFLENTIGIAGFMLTIWAVGTFAVFSIKWVIFLCNWLQIF